MAQINVNSTPPVDDGARTTGAGATMLAVILAIVVAIAIFWMLFSGAFSGPASSSTTVNVNPPAQSAPARGDGPSVNIDVPKVDANTQAQLAAPAKP